MAPNFNLSVCFSNVSFCCFLKSFNSLSNSSPNVAVYSSRNFVFKSMYFSSIPARSLFNNASLLVNTLRSSSLRLLMAFNLRAARFSSYSALLILPFAYFSSSAFNSSSMDFSRKLVLYSSNARMACSLSFSWPSSFNASRLSWYSFSNANSSARSAFSISMTFLRLSSAAWADASAACLAASALSLAASLAACAFSASITLRS